MERASLITISDPSPDCDERGWLVGNWWRNRFEIVAGWKRWRGTGFHSQMSGK